MRVLPCELDAAAEQRPTAAEHFEGQLYTQLACEHAPSLGDDRSPIAASDHAREVPRLRGKRPLAGAAEGRALGGDDQVVAGLTQLSPPAHAGA